MLQWFSSDPRQRYQKIPQSDPDETVSVLHGGLSEEDDLEVCDNYLASPRVPVGGEKSLAHRKC